MVLSILKLVKNTACVQCSRPKLLVWQIICVLLIRLLISTTAGTLVILKLVVLLFMTFMQVQLKKVAYDSGLGCFIWFVSPDKYVEVYQEGFTKKKDIYVKTGQKIGKMTGSHLHLGLSKTTKDYINKHSFPCKSWNVDNGTWLNSINVIKKYYNSKKVI